GGGDQNLYRWEGNQPSNVTDPSGLWWFDFGKDVTWLREKLQEKLLDYLASFQNAVRNGTSDGVGGQNGVGGASIGGWGGSAGPVESLRMIGRMAWDTLAELFRRPTPPNWPDLKNISDGGAGWADGLTGGVTQQIRAGLGYDDAVDKNSPYYQA